MLVHGDGQPDIGKVPDPASGDAAHGDDRNAEEDGADGDDRFAFDAVPVRERSDGWTREKVGEHRRYDDRLAMFLMRSRDPPRYGKYLDKKEYDGHDEVFAVRLAKLMLEVESEELDDGAHETRCRRGTATQESQTGKCQTGINQTGGDLV